MKDESVELLRAFSDILVEEFTEQRKEQLRTTVGYARFRKVLAVLQTKPLSIENVMLAIHNLVDEYKGFGYAWISYVAQECVHLLIEEAKEQDFSLPVVPLLTE